MKNKLLISIFLGILGIALFNLGNVRAQLADTSWPMIGGGPQHRGLSTIDTSHINGTIKWTFETGERIESSPVVDENGIIYFGNHENDFYAINPDGTLKWKLDIGNPEYAKVGDPKGILSTPAIAKDGTVYFSSLSDYLFALDPGGAEKWKFRLAITSDTWTSPLIDSNGTIYIGSAMSFKSGDLEDDPSEPTGKLFAINPDGTEKWNFATQSNVATCPAIGSDSTIYLGNYVPMTDLGRLYAINPDGTEKWHFDTDQLIESSPAIDKDGIIYVGTLSGKVYAINPDGTEKWHFQTGDGVSAIPAIGKDGTVYVGSWDAYFYAINPDGTLKWKYKTPDTFEAIIASAAIGKEGTIYIGAGSGIFYAFNPDGTVKWDYESPDIDGFASSPAIGADGTIYVGSQSGKLLAFSGSSTEEEKSTFKIPVIYYGLGILVITLLIAGVVIFVIKKQKNPEKSNY
ncbi:PQQ-binding-like beta-propeller repeat protein [Patescibacteria group bacterium]